MTRALTIANVALPSSISALLDRETHGKPHSMRWRTPRSNIRTTHAERTGTTHQRDGHGTRDESAHRTRERRLHCAQPCQWRGRNKHRQKDYFIRSERKLLTRGRGSTRVRVIMACVVQLAALQKVLDVEKNGEDTATTRMATTVNSHSGPNTNRGVPAESITNQGTTDCQIVFHHSPNPCTTPNNEASRILGVRRAQGLPYHDEGYRGHATKPNLGDAGKRHIMVELEPKKTNGETCGELARGTTNDTRSFSFRCRTRHHGSAQQVLHRTSGPRSHHTQRPLQQELLLYHVGNNEHLLDCVVEDGVQECLVMVTKLGPYIQVLFIFA